MAALGRENPPALAEFHKTQYISGVILRARFFRAEDIAAARMELNARAPQIVQCKWTLWGSK